VEHWVKLAKLLEEAKFHGVFFADVLGIYDVYKGPSNNTPALQSASQIPIGDPR
jgi:alkanesulfonate monooxygenase SsuD/methylene tetrahydromethanopterin reductase-like flavin-dependent oxidoreductase (luciferase family)